MLDTKIRIFGVIKGKRFVFCAVMKRTAGLILPLLFLCTCVTLLKQDLKRQLLGTETPETATERAPDLLWCVNVY
jgi:hypothetical protein